eukprot:CAMPEP_0177158070 /NCGR_PEP_ID=MMETSP0367-20130122/3597_1 /TAXON_ID=447022 ORGANISM="Scrippsiella hangoei-like, Strain SHHI-4" /NCGR_SAMPLE_ID=MMETSP0367 /ASSEMBLY_ACC=CAM_ASM_000362 /LENGTH=226 /DNA_ID=CAMNT_0018603633 /DNA_START=1 /DNA_END=678 /DNA_ORIENTATION=-
MTQVEERYSMTGVSRVSPTTLLLLCGDDPFEVQGTGPDVLVSLLDGWVEFAMPREQATKLQNLRYALRQAFLAYCEAPFQKQTHAAALDCAVSLLQASLDEAGAPVANEDAGYRPSVVGVPVPVAKAVTSAAADALPVGAAKGAGRVVAPSFGQPSSKASAVSPPAGSKGGCKGKVSAPAIAPVAPVLAEGQEIAGIQDLVREIYGHCVPGQKPITWASKQGQAGQ